MKIIIAFACCSLLIVETHAQAEYFDLMEVQEYFDPVDLYEYWQLEQINDIGDLATSTSSEKLNVLSILNSEYVYKDSIFKSRLRINQKSRNLRVSLLMQKDHRRAGVEYAPLPKNLRIFIGDLEIDHGFGLVFSSRRHFKSWTQDPHLQLYRSRGLTAKATSNTNHSLRGGGLSYTLHSFTLEAFFSPEVQGASLVYEKNKLHAGAALIESAAEGSTFYRFGGYLKYRIGFGIIFTEFSFQDNRANAYESGFSFFGHDRHHFIIKFHGYSKSFDPYMTRMNFSKPAKIDDQEISINYLWEWRSGWYFQSYLETSAAKGLLLHETEPKTSWIFNGCIKKQIFTKTPFLFRVSFSPKGSKVLVRWRHEYSESRYFQLESGWARSKRPDAGIVENRYVGLDTKIQAILPDLDVQSGICLHSSDRGAQALYRYEPELYYQMSLPVLTGSGLRGYVKLRYSILENLQFELKVNRAISYSGKQEILKSQLKFQFIFRPSFVVRSSEWHPRE